MSYINDMITLVLTILGLILAWIYVMEFISKKDHRLNKKEKSKKLICQVCEKNEAKGVYCVPSIPMSMAYCQECILANAHPWFILVANTACIGGLHKAAPFWRQMVVDTCKHLGRSFEEFNSHVESDMESFNSMCENHDK